jgi:hypothetical protein
MLGAYEDEIMEGFVRRLDPVNAVADASLGFVWRYETEDEEPEEVRVFGNESILFNMSVWESIEDLEAFVYSSNHLEVLQKKSQWFERSTRAPLVLWWVEAGHIPSVEEAKQHFDMLWRNGPSAAAFSFKDRFAPPAA